jgi:hypothetical protein
MKNKINQTRHSEQRLQSLLSVALHELIKHAWPMCYCSVPSYRYANTGCFAGNQLGSLYILMHCAQKYFAASPTK